MLPVPLEVEVPSTAAGWGDAVMLKVPDTVHGSVQFLTARAPDGSGLSGTADLRIWARRVDLKALGINKDEAYVSVPNSQLDADSVTQVELVVDIDGLTIISGKLASTTPGSPLGVANIPDPGGLYRIPAQGQLWIAAKGIDADLKVTLTLNVPSGVKR